MSGIDPIIFKHEIKTYMDARPVRQCHIAVNPRKAPIIKEKVENLLVSCTQFP
jgi:hypothetical protein